MGRTDDARHVLSKLRANKGESQLQLNEKVDNEFQGILDVVAIERQHEGEECLYKSFHYLFTSSSSDLAQTSWG